MCQFFFLATDVNLPAEELFLDRNFMAAAQPIWKDVSSDAVSQLQHSWKSYNSSLLFSPMTLVESKFNDE
jgi:hypothetical protein